MSCDSETLRTSCLSGDRNEALSSPHWNPVESSTGMRELACELQRSLECTVRLRTQGSVSRKSVSQGSSEKHNWEYSVLGKVPEEGKLNPGILRWGGSSPEAVPKEP